MELLPWHLRAQTKGLAVPQTSQSLSALWPHVEEHILPWPSADPTEPRNASLSLWTGKSLGAQWRGLLLC